MSIGTSIIRVDASLAIGYGHLSRCLLMADKMTKEGWIVRFVTAKKQAKDLIEKSGYFCEKITYNGKIPSHLLKKSIPIVIVADINSKVIFNENKEYEEYINTLHQQAGLLLTFEDMIDYPYQADIVVIPYCGAENLKIGNRNKTKYLLGSKYFPLKVEFKDMNTTISKSVNNIIVTMGGGDPDKITLKVLQALNYEGVDAAVTVVVGGMSEISDQDINSCSGNIAKKISIKRDVSNMAELISKSDIAFTNSGLTKYEISALGIPSILISNTEQHAEYSELFSKSGSAIHLGFHNMVENKDIINAYNTLKDNYKKRDTMSKNSKNLVKNTGIEKIYQAIIKSLEQL